jgi:RNA polymerase sigma factor (sigma-70 family)
VEEEEAQVPSIGEVMTAALGAARYEAAGDDGIAEDATQETLLRYLSREGVREPIPWARKVAKNLVRDRVRLDKGHRRKQRVSRLASLGTPQAANVILEQVARQPGPSADVADRSVIADALATLDEVSRAALVMTVVEGRPAEEVGEALGLSADAVYQRVSRAKQELRRQLGE